MTNEQAEYLLNLPKKIVEDNVVLEYITVNQKLPFNKRFELISEQDGEFTFLWEIQQSTKNSMRISLHCQENESKIGLLRIDYNGGHVNPEIISDSVPEKFHRYAGKTFLDTEPHIHYHVEGYKSLQWAIPLSDDEFQIKKLDKDIDFYNSLANATKLFAKTINVETKITINTLLL